MVFRGALKPRRYIMSYSSSSKARDGHYRGAEFSESSKVEIMSVFRSFAAEFHR